MLYFHIPFCKQICSYCDFFHSASPKLIEPVVQKMVEELWKRKNYLPLPPNTIYFGGGTPTAIPLDDIELLFNTALKLWPNNKFEEATIEANPDDITPQLAQRLLDIGFNRISLGIQSFNDDHLKLMNRRHSAEQAIAAVKTLKNAGFKNITIDLIYAMPFLTDQQWQTNLDIAVSLDVQHISAYHLTIEPKTQFGKQNLVAAPDSVSEKHFAMLGHTLCDAGFEHYEISNFARIGLRAKHNSGYWNAQPYLGIGPSAHSFDGSIRRSWNVSSNKLYLANAPAQEEILTDRDVYNERIMTRLRTADGLANPDNELLKRAEKFLLDGKLVHEKGVLRIPQNHFLLSDYLIGELFQGE